MTGIDYGRFPSPCYILDEARLRRNLALIDRVQREAGVEIILAFKGFAMWKAFPIVREYLPGATASSLHEARLCFEEMGVPAHTYAAAYIPEEFEEILGYSSHLTFNSLSQYRRYREQVLAHGRKISMGLRVNPEYSDVATEIYNPASPHSRLGVTAEHLADGLPADIEGLHFHTLCESSSFALEKLIENFEARFGHLLPQLKWVNMGGGHLMTRIGYDIDHLIGILKAFRDKHGVQVILEPGSAIAWTTGELKSTVLDIVENNGVKTALLDVSFTAHMPDTLEMPYRPRVLGAGDPGPDTHNYRLGGTSCLAGDFHTEYGFPEPLEPGSQVLLSDMIHYTMVKSTTFNGVRHPSIGMWTSAGEAVIFRTFDYADFKNRLS